MARGKNRRLRLIPSHLPLIRDKLADFAQYRLGELGSQTQYEALMANAWSMTDQIRTAQLWWVSRDMTRLAEDTVQAGDFPEPDPPASRESVPDISPHSLRRTFCTLSRDAGVPDRDIMAAGGWNSPQMLDYYDMSRRGLNGKAGDGLQDYLGKED